MQSVTTLGGKAGGHRYTIPVLLPQEPPPVQTFLLPAIATLHALSPESEPRWRQSQPCVETQHPRDPNLLDKAMCHPHLLSLLLRASSHGTNKTVPLCCEKRPFFLADRKLGLKKIHTAGGHIVWRETRVAADKNTPHSPACVLPVREM